MAGNVTGQSSNYGVPDNQGGDGGPVIGDPMEAVYNGNNPASAVGSSNVSSASNNSPNGLLTVPAEL